MEFYELGSYKEKIIQAMAGCSEITSLVSPAYCFDLPYMNGLAPTGENFICIDSFIAKAGSKARKEVGVNIWLMFHRDNLNLSAEERETFQSQGFCGNSLDIAVQAVGRLLNGSKDFGIGSLTPIPENPAVSFIPDTEDNEYCGKLLSYTCTDFMNDFRKVF